METEKRKFVSSIVSKSVQNWLSRQDNINFEVARNCKGSDIKAMAKDIADELGTVISSLTTMARISGEMPESVIIMAGMAIYTEICEMIHPYNPELVDAISEFDEARLKKVDIESMIKRDNTKKAQQN